MKDAIATRVSTCDLWLDFEPWLYALDNAAAIDAHWQTCLAMNPHYFNGTVHLIRDYTIADGVLTARFLRTDFKSYLHWRDRGYKPAGAYDAFGSAIVRSLEGHILLGRQKNGINAGRVYLPGGFIDARDVTPSSAIDIAGSIAREIAEETQLDVAPLDVVPGFLIVRDGALLSIGQELRAPQTAPAFKAEILANLAADPDPELADVVMIGSPDDMTGLDVIPYSAIAVRAILNR